MYIEKIIIENFKCFNGRFKLNLNKHLNILVGDNEVGKTTILEAINLALTGLYGSKWLRYELTQYLFSNETTFHYLESLKSNDPNQFIDPPQILIELYFQDIEDDSVRALFEGNGNSEKTKACGVQFIIRFNEIHKPLYEEMIKAGDINSIPIEYYDFFWSSFAREGITPSAIPLKSALIDSSSARYQNGSDVYISRILRDKLTESQSTNIAQAHRKMRDAFMENPAVKAINDELKDASISDKKVEITVELSSKDAWETSLITTLDKIPFHFIGKGEQSLVKTRLALSHKKSVEANIILLEEPENHLAYPKLNKLIKEVSNSNKEKQILVSTHSSFVANKLGLENLILINIDITTKEKKETRFSDLSLETKEFFARLPGYDTLRLLLSSKVILVEGDSDELIVQKAYYDKNESLPIENGIDVISVGMSFLRFLELSNKLSKPTSVVTDNDGNVESLKEKYKDYLGDNKKDFIEICFDEDIDNGVLNTGDSKFNYNTLEPKILKANSLNTLNEVFETTFKTEEEMHIHMHANKTSCALKIFNTNKKIEFPGYIKDAINI